MKGTIKVRISDDLLLDVLYLNTDEEATDIELVGAEMGYLSIYLTLASDKFPVAEEVAPVCMPVFRHENTKIIKWGFEGEGDEKHP